jgi:hypothetical protein
MPAHPRVHCNRGSTGVGFLMRGGLMSVIEMRLMCVSGGPTLDFQDAAEFLAGFQPAIDAALRRRLQ